jgi:hypothetical protein
MTARNHENAEAQDILKQSDGAAAPLTAERAGVSLTNSESNVAHRAMQLAAADGTALGGPSIRGAQTSER